MPLPHKPTDGSDDHIVYYYSSPISGNESAGKNSFLHTLSEVL